MGSDFALKLVSWNVNGLRACMAKGLPTSCRRRTRTSSACRRRKCRRSRRISTSGYTEYWFSAEKKGYSGTAVFTKTEPLSVSYGIGLAEVDAEGRVICAEYPDFYLVTVYTPNAQRELVRIDFRMRSRTRSARTSRSCTRKSRSSSAAT